ncbi:MAG: RIP metalloprotease RseP [Coxiella sp. RIFCSPHIGHO2_12_FULL_42_15]|nr:MAG: RIP metalloprotease RseP [Coxiella sp. RIFCSPHIGHO2_12_FULL_42_15]
MQLAVSIIGAILAIFLIIIIHEMGHFFVARAFGIKILRFSLGFGKALYKRTGNDGTEYVLALIPLGGYVKMLGEADVQSVPQEEMHRAFHRKPLLVRMGVVLAGPVTNFILAILVFWAAYLIGMEHVKPIIGRIVPHSFAAAAGLKPGDRIVRVGETPTYHWQQVVMSLLTSMGNVKKAILWVEPKGTHRVIERRLDLSGWKLDKRNPQVFETLGLSPYFPPIKPIILKVLPESPAAKAHLKSHDLIVAVNGQRVKEWAQVTETVSQWPEKKIMVTVLRGQRTYEIPVYLGVQQRDKQKVGYLGVMVKAPKYPENMIHLERYNVLTAWVPATIKSWDLLKYNAIVLVKMMTAKLSFKTIGGPISIFQAAGQATQAGWGIYLSFIGFISLTVGFINLLPIPGLDGGHLLFQLIEGMIRRPVPEKIQQYGFTLGMLFVLLIVVHATINDLLRIFGSA